MSKSVAYYSHTYYDVNGLLMPYNAIFDMPTRQASNGRNTSMYCVRHPVVHMPAYFGRAPAARCFSHKVLVPSKT